MTAEKGAPRRRKGAADPACNYCKGSGVRGWYSFRDVMILACTCTQKGRWR